MTKQATAELFEATVQALTEGNAIDARLGLELLSRSRYHVELLPAATAYKAFSEPFRAELAPLIRDANVAAARNVTRNWATY